MQRGVVAHPVEDLVQVGRAERLGAEGAVLVGEGLNLRQADVMDLLSGEVRGREVPQGPRVRVVAAVEVREPGAVVGARDRQYLVTQHVAVCGESGAQAAFHG